MSSLVYNNFVSGVLDSSLGGRFDSPFYSKGCEYSKNFISTYKGNLKNRTGFEFITKSRENKKAFLFEFKFNNKQSYLVEATDEYFRFYTYDSDGVFGYVVDDDGKPIELNTGISYELFKTAQFAQNSDVMYITGNFNPQKLVRKSANSFTIENCLFSGIDFNDIGYPKACCFYRGRLYLGGFIKKPTTIKGSKVIDYGNFAVPTSNIKADDPLSLTLSEISMPISWMKGGDNNLIVGNGEGISVVNGGESGKAIESTKVSANLGNKQGASECLPVEKDSLLIYFDNNGKSAYAFEYDYLTETFLANDLNLLAVDVIKSPIKQAVFKDDGDKMIWCLMENGQMMCLLYNKAESIIGWFPIITEGFVNNISIATTDNGDKDLFINVMRNGINFIERLSPKTVLSDHEFLGLEKESVEYKRLISEEVKNWSYLDSFSVYKNEFNSTITFDGEFLHGNFSEAMVDNIISYKTKTGKEVGIFKILEFMGESKVRVEQLSECVYPLSWNSWYISFNKLYGLEDFNEVTVFADGGYLGQFEVNDGMIDLEKNFSVVTVGYPYESLFKTFNIGSYVQGVNLQTKKKNVTSFVVRCINSAGGEIGTGFDNTSVLQVFSPRGVYDTPPLPIDGDVFIKGFRDEYNTDKRFYIKQSLPLPLNIVMVESEINYGADR